MKEARTSSCEREQPAPERNMKWEKGVEKTRSPAPASFSCLYYMNNLADGQKEPASRFLMFLHSQI